MTKKEFVIALKKANMTKKEFAHLSGMTYTTVAQWSDNKPPPAWVESWLNNYQKAKILDSIANSIRPYIPPHKDDTNN